MASQTALLNWIQNPERTKLELMNSRKEHSADGSLLDAIEAQLYLRWPNWKDLPKPFIRKRKLTEDELMAQIDAALENVGETHGDQIQIK
jgi:hypothetical protein